MRTTLPILLICSALPVVGCARGNVDLLEAQLRNREAELRSLNGQLELKDQELARYQRENRLLQQQLADNAPPPEATARLARIEKIEINRQLTGALDQDSHPGDDILNVVVAPLDSRGEVVRLDGDIEIEAIDPGLPEDQRTLGRWTIGIDEAAETWHEGFIGKGYQLTTPWQRIPQSKEIVLLARYKTPDGREFSASQNITVDPGPEGTPGLLPLPQVKQETLPPPPAPAAKSTEIERVSFEEFVKEQEAELRKGNADKPEPPPLPGPVVTSSTAPLVQLQEPIESAERPDIPLPEDFPEPAEEERPPFVE